MDDVQQPNETGDHACEVAAGQRFSFGENWRQFLSVLDDERIAEAQTSLRRMLGVGSLASASFLDVGCGSGLFSLSALRLGATRIHSFDFDPGSVGCAQELKSRYAAGADHWTIEPGSVLDPVYVRSLGTFDIVYSCGVLHHTGGLEQALEAVANAVAPGGRLFISIYNDQGLRSRVWRRIKRGYNRLPPPLRPAYVLVVMAPREILSAGLAVAQLQPLRYVRSWTEYKRQRGMSRWHDLVDWVGGYPFEVASPERIFDHYRVRGFTLVALRTCGGGLGCNEFVFVNSGRAATG
ncbi:MAG: class I SAM-dependent methyltransferase [Solirubrobacteraceae bacterium]